MSGPKVNPMPNATPIRAMPCDRFSGAVLSAMTALAVLTLAPAMPAPVRLTNSSTSASVAEVVGSVQANPNRA